MTIFSPWDVIQLDFIWREDSRKEIILWNWISRWNSQLCYLERSKNSDRVIKILTWNSWRSTKDFLEVYGISNISDFHFRVLSAVEKAGVLLPNYWNVIRWSINGEEIHGFLQSYLWQVYGGIWWKLPNIWQNDSAFIWKDRRSYNGPHQRDSDAQEFHRGIFFDWDTYLSWVITWKWDDEPFEDFYKRIAETKIN